MSNKRGAFKAEKEDDSAWVAGGGGEDEETQQVPPSWQHFPSWNSFKGNEDDGAKATVATALEQIPDAPPSHGAFAAFGAFSWFGASKTKGRGLEETRDSDSNRPPVPPCYAVGDHDDSIELEANKIRQSRYGGPKRPDWGQVAPRPDAPIPPIESSFSHASEKSSRHGSGRLTHGDGSPHVSGSGRLTHGDGSAITVDGDESAITAEVAAVSPYVNDADEIVVPEAVAIDPLDIPAAEVVRPDKYALTIAGRRVKFRVLALAAVLVLATVVAVAVAMTKRASGGGDPDPGTGSGGGYVKVVEAPAPSGAPSQSLLPSSYPSMMPSSGPSTALQAELMDVIARRSGGVSPSFADPRSPHRVALDWLVEDQAGWEGAPLSEAELVERFVLALLYYETHGEEWYKSFHFMTGEHICRWRDYVDRRFKKGVITCADGRIRNLTLWGNNLDGGLPTEIGLLQELTALHVGLNDIHGDIPSSIGSLTSITHLELNNNDFSGTIDSLSGLTNLKFIDLSSNEMTGSLMDPSNLTSLESFRANGNRFSGSVPASFSNITSLETLHLQWNKLTGNVDFFCQDLPPDHQFDCDGSTPDVECACCVECTLISDSECSEHEKLLTLAIDAGGDGRELTWELIDRSTGAVIAADGGYDDGQEINVQLCVAFPRDYYIKTRAPVTPIAADALVGVLQVVNETRIGFDIDGQEWTIGPNDQQDFFVSTPSPTMAPTTSALPTTTTASPTDVNTMYFTTPNYAHGAVIEATIPPPLSIVLAPPCNPFDLSLHTDAFGLDTSWEIYDKNKGVVVISDGGFDSNQTLQFNECLDQMGCYEFVIKDDWDDGICCEQGRGKYEVSVNGRMIGSGGKFGSSETTFLGGNCGSDPSDGGACPEGHSLLFVSAFADFDTSWEVFDTSTGQIYATNENPMIEPSDVSKCIPKKDCYQFTIRNDYGAGDAKWTVEYEGDVVSTGDRYYRESVSALFGSGCLPQGLI